MHTSRFATSREGRRQPIRLVLCGSAWSKPYVDGHQPNAQEDVS
jgi:hypothetical protein